MAHRRSGSFPADAGAVMVVGWVVTGAAFVSSAAAIVISAIALRSVTGRSGEPADHNPEQRNYTRTRISAVGADRSRALRPVVSAVPPENPHAPPTPPLGNPSIRP